MSPSITPPLQSGAPEARPARWILAGVVRAERPLGSIQFWWLVSLLFAALLAWDSRQSMNPDGMSYLEMASGALHRGPMNLVNGWWSPGYPALLSVALLVFHPSPQSEFPLTHFVNFLVFVFALLSFTFFLRSWLAALRQTPLNEDEPPLVAFSFAVFLPLTITYIGLETVAPDLCVAGIAFLAAGLCCRISLLGFTRRRAAALGAILGVGYYVKTAMFPISLILLAALFVWPPSGKFRRREVIWPLLAFLIVAAPLAALISSRVGHLSIGESGPVNYLMHATGAMRNGPAELENYAGKGALAHPPRILLNKPLTVEFSYPLDGTDPLHYEPSYWWAGARAGFNLKAQLAALRAGLRYYLAVLAEMKILLVGALVLCVCGFHLGFVSAPGRSGLWLIIWPAAACLMFAFVLVDSRYVAGFYVLFWLGVYGSLWRSVPGLTRAAVLGTVSCVLLLPAAHSGLAAAKTAVKGMVRQGGGTPSYLVIAAALRANGVNPGDRLATVGRIYDAYYAHHLGARIVAEIEDAEGFWRLPAGEAGKVEESLANLGVKALISEKRPVSGIPSDGWQEITLPDSGRFSMLMLSGMSTAAPQPPRLSP